MSELLTRLADLLAATPASDPLPGFGLECRRTRGRRTPSGCMRWEENWQIAGSGMVRCTTFRSLGDQPGAEAGIWQVRLEPQDIRPLAEVLVETRLHEARPYHVEPGNLMIRVQVVAGGLAESQLLSGDLTDHLNKFRPVQLEAAELMNRAMEAPLRTVGLSIELPLRLPRSKVRVPVAFTLHNSGVQGHWVRNPLSAFPALAENDIETNRLYVALQPQRVPGETPLPPVPVAVDLELPAGSVRETGDYEYIWLDAGEAQTFELSAALDLRQPGEYLFWGEFASYTSLQPVDGKPRFAGAVFSDRTGLMLIR